MTVFIFAVTIVVAMLALAVIVALVIGKAISLRDERG